MFSYEYFVIDIFLYEYVYMEIFVNTGTIFLLENNKNIEEQKNYNMFVKSSKNCIKNISIKEVFFNIYYRNISFTSYKF